MKYYYGNDYKEALSNNPVEINDTKILEGYKEVYNCVIPADDIDDEDADICLDSDSCELAEDYGTLKICKDIFDDYIADSIIAIRFPDEEGEPIMEYQMVDEDDDWIYCEYFG